MNDKSLVITANRTKIRAFQQSNDRDNPDSQLHLHELELQPDQSGPIALTHESTDQAGRFEKGNPPAQPQGYAAGERHTVEEEAHRRQAETLARVVSGIVEDQAVLWTLIAPAQLMNALDERLSQKAKDNLIDKISGDWTGMSLAQVEKKVLG